jgi:glycosyltransferase involved in cell wall biosynthesis
VLLGNARFPIREPFAGGLESLTWQLVAGLRRRGAQVTLFAGKGSDPRLGAREMDIAPLDLSASARADVSMVPEPWLREHHAYLQVILQLMRADAAVDIVHNNCLHYLPIAMAGALAAPLVTTLHTPPTPWLEPAITLADGCDATFVAVSEHTASAWRHATNSEVIPNGIDLDRWQFGTGGGALVWFGRIVPEKGAHLAAKIARAAGMPLRLAGPIGDQAYFRSTVQPLLGAGIEYVGHLRQHDVARLVAASAATLVTPCWDEPYGLVVAESLACGTPVCGFARGGVPELVSPECGHLVAAEDPEIAATVLEGVIRLDRRGARLHAERHCSLERMLDDYTDLYQRLGAAA